MRGEKRLMNKRELGKTGIMMTELGYGCTAQFGKDFLGKQCISFDHALSLIRTALETGIYFFDTGFNYGYAEERLGLCLSNIFESGICKREDIVIQTKGCETLKEDGTYGPADYTPGWIKKTVEISLKRLKLDYIDLFALHSAKPENITDELIYLFEDLKREGMIKAFGVAGISDEMGEWVSSHQSFDYVMMTYNYAEAKRNALIEKLGKNGVGIITGGSLNRSLSTFRLIPHSFSEMWYIARAMRNFRNDLKRQKRFDFVNHVDGMTPQQVSLAYILRNENVASACFNSVNIQHLKDNAEAVNKILPPYIIEKIEREGME